MPLPHLVEPCTRAVVAAVLAFAAMSAGAAEYRYSFYTFFDPTTADLYDTRSVAQAAATLTLADVEGGVRFSLAQPEHDLVAASEAGTFLQSLWINGPAATLTALDGVPLASTSGRLSAPVTLDGGLSYRWRFDFAPGSFGEGQSASWTLTGAGLSASSLSTSAGWPQLTLTGVGAPFDVRPQGALNFVALTPVVAVPEPASWLTLAMGLVALASLQGWRSLKRRPQTHPATR